MKRNSLGVTVLCLTLMSACATTDESLVAPVEDNLGVALLYVENEPGADPGNVIIFVNKDIVRIDDQQFPNDFVLFDRKTRTINNVVGADKSIYVFSPNEVKDAPPIPIAYTHEKQESAAIPRGGDTSKGFHYRFFANGALCYNVVVAEDFLPEVVEALKEFRLALAGEHIRSVGRLPPEQVDACDLALNVYHPTRHLDFGFPVREWNPNGYSKFLKDIKRGVAMEPAYTHLPEGYKLYPFGQKAPALN